MHEGLVIIKEPNGVINEEYLKQVLEDYSGCCGAASVDDNDLDVNSTRGAADLKYLDNLQEKFLDKRMVFYFGNHPEGFPDDQMQPFTVLSDQNGDPVVITIIDGDFPGFEKSGSAYSSAYHFTQDKLTDMVEALWNEVEGDTDELVKKMQEGPFKEELSNQLRRGAVVFMTYDDKVAVCQKTEAAGDFDGFWCSDKLGYSEGEDEEKKEEPKEEPKKKGVVSRKPSKLVMAPPSAPGTGPQPPIPEPTKKPDAQTPPAAAYIMMRCPAEIIKNKDIKSWYEKFHGVCPGNYKQRPEVRVDVSKIKSAAAGGSNWAKKVMEGQQVRPLAELEKKINGGSDPHVRPTLPVSPPTEKPATIPIADTKPIESEDQTRYIPSAQEIGQYFKDFTVRKDLVGLLDAEGNPIPLDPDKIQGIENKRTSIWDIMKTTPLKMARWSDDALVIFLSSYPRFRFRVLKSLLAQIAIQELSNKKAEEVPPTKGVVVKKKSA